MAEDNKKLVVHGATIPVYSGSDTTEDGVYTHVANMFFDEWQAEIMADSEDDDVITTLKVFLMNSIEESLLALGKAKGCYKIVKGQQVDMPLWKTPKAIPDICIKTIAARSGKFCKLITEDGQGVLAVHYSHGDNKGLWRQVTDVKGDESTVTAERTEAIRWLHRWNAGLKCNEEREILNSILSHLPVRFLTRDTHLLPVLNGVFQYTSFYDGVLIPWEEVEEKHPDWTFSSKVPFNLHIGAPLAEPEIIEPDGTVWKPISWLHTLVNTDDEVKALLEVMHAALQAWHNWKAVIFMLDGTLAATGNNGKSTLIELIMRLLGGIYGGQVTALPIARFGDDFMLESAVNTSLIISHENEQIPGPEALGVLKAIATGNSVPISRKFKKNISGTINALIIQAFNAVKAFPDYGENFERRLRAFTFKNCFTGQEKAYIAEDYLKRKEVLEYLLWYLVFKVGNITELTKFDFYKDTLAFFKESTDTMVQFLNDTINQPGYIVNDYIKAADLYPIYSEWYKDGHNGSLTKALTKQGFKQRFATASKFCTEFIYDERVVRVKQGAVNGEYEPIVYDFSIWQMMNAEAKEYNSIRTPEQYKYCSEDVKESLCKYKVPDTIKGALIRRSLVEKK